MHRPAKKLVKNLFDLPIAKSSIHAEITVAGHFVKKVHKHLLQQVDRIRQPLIFG